MCSHVRNRHFEKLESHGIFEDLCNSAVLREDCLTLLVSLTFSKDLFCSIEAGISQNLELYNRRIILGGGESRLDLNPMKIYMAKLYSKVLN